MTAGKDARLRPEAVPRSDADMDKSIERIIRRVLEDACAKGRDHLTQTELAVRAVCQARPDMTASDALATMIHPRHLADSIVARLISVSAFSHSLDPFRTSGASTLSPTTLFSVPVTN